MTIAESFLSLPVPSLEPTETHQTFQAVVFSVRKV